MIFLTFRGYSSVTIRDMKEADARGSHANSQRRSFVRWYTSKQWTSSRCWMLDGCVVGAVGLEDAAGAPGVAGVADGAAVLDEV